MKYYVCNTVTGVCLRPDYLKRPKAGSMLRRRRAQPPVTYYGQPEVLPPLHLILHTLRLNLHLNTTLGLCIRFRILGARRDPNLEQESLQSFSESSATLQTGLRRVSTLHTLVARHQP